MEENASRAEAERLLGIAEKFLRTRDLVSCRDFAVLAQETAPLLEGSDLILAISDVLLAADKRINNNHPNWYAILQLDTRSDDLDILKKQYRRLALLLHPDKNKFPFAHDAFQLVADAWAVVSDPVKKSIYDSEFHKFSRIDLSNSKKQKQSDHNHKLPFRKPAAPQRPSTFWTACPYCYNLYEYPLVYKDCCLKCNNCERAMHAAEIPTLPPIAQGKEAYYCCWGFFPIGFTGQNGGGGQGKSGFPNWMQPMFGNVEAGMRATVGYDEEEEGFVNVSAGNGKRSGNVTPVHKPKPVPKPGAKKRGRPRKNPQI